MKITPHEAAEEARSQVEHVFGYSLDFIKTDRASLGLPAEFEFACLIKGHDASGEVVAEIIRQFTEGCPIDDLKGLLPDCGHKRPRAAKTIALVKTREPLFKILEALYTRGENDTSYEEFHRPDATLFLIYNIYGRPT